MCHADGRRNGLKIAQDGRRRPAAIQTVKTTINAAGSAQKAAEQARREVQSMIYAEWKLYGEFYNGFFAAWPEFFAATFSPDCEILVVKQVPRR